MDERLHMIVDLERRGDKSMYLTKDVTMIKRDKDGLYLLRFANSPHPFKYRPSRLLYMDKPEQVDLKNKGIYIHNVRVNNATQVLRFSDGRHSFYRVTYKSGYSHNYEGHEVYITRTALDKQGGSLWSYLYHLAQETGMKINIDGKELNILLRQYNLVDRLRDNVPLAQYIGDPKKLATYRPPRQIYYPFGCNDSQKTAVERALTNQLSIIQGPPGTGKTQTILNIIANLLMMGKTILVVSNNNSAVENVAEKLQKEDLGFLVAQLGNSANVGAFISNQPSYPEMDDWALRKHNQIEQEASSSLDVATKGFEAERRKAILLAELEALKIESKHHDQIGEQQTNTEWLCKKSSKHLIRLLCRYRVLIEQGKSPSLWFRLRWAVSLGRRIFSFLLGEPQEVITQIESAYYTARRGEIEQELSTIGSLLQSIDIEQATKNLRTASLSLLKSHLQKRYTKKNRPKFGIFEIQKDSKKFLQEYPIVLSTTYSSRGCINEGMVFDYLIMDEASQVDIKTGALALSCATNAVIVGDDKQLPNVVSREEAIAIESIQQIYQVDERYDALKNSFLSSCGKVFDSAPATLLREHYRCHPRIIEFCNQRFYGGELIAMTTDKGEDKVIEVVKTVKGNHARGTHNQREVDVISQEVLPQYTDMGSLGIITPYNSQSNSINKAIGKEVASTVHKYQGRECDTIIMSMVDNQPTTFSDDPNLLNVAISRAKSHLCVVLSGNELPQDSNIAQFVDYVAYHNMEVRESQLRSIFDLLYQQYTAERLAYMATHQAVSEQFSENLLYDALIESIREMHLPHTGVLCHYPLSALIGEIEVLTHEEQVFAQSPLAHIDFLIYNTLSKRALMAIELDGWSYHHGREVQQERDRLKDNILRRIGLKLYRMATSDTINPQILSKLLREGCADTTSKEERSQ